MLERQVCLSVRIRARFRPILSASKIFAFFAVFLTPYLTKLMFYDFDCNATIDEVLVEISF